MNSGYRVMAKTGMMNLSDGELSNMVKYPNEEAIKYGKQEPYYLKYIREQKEKKDKKKD